MALGLELLDLVPEDTVAQWVQLVPDVLVAMPAVVYRTGLEPEDAAVCCMYFEVEVAAAHTHCLQEGLVAIDSAAVGTAAMKWAGLVVVDCME